VISVLVLAAAGTAQANVCAVDDVPAATLLFPFVVFDFDAHHDGTNGQDTIFSIANMAAEAQVVHVTIWTDFGAPILDFNILLTGYDVISMKASTIFGGGQLPVTRNEGHGTPPRPYRIEGVQPNGPVSGLNGPLNGWWIEPGLDEPEATNTMATGRCDPGNPSYPGLYQTPIPPAFLDLFEHYLQVSQTVSRSHSDDCVQAFGDQYVPTPAPFWISRDGTSPTWMYITADVVERCEQLDPTEEGYYQNQIRNDNVLVGDVFWVNHRDRLSEASNAIHVETSAHLETVGTMAPTGAPVSFYHRYSILQDQSSDGREPLPTAWAFRYLGVGLPEIGTNIRVWKGSTLFADTIDLERVGELWYSPDELVASNCHAYTYYAWDEQEMVTVVPTWPLAQTANQPPWQAVPNQLPLATQEVPVDQFDVPSAHGWMLFVWPASNYDQDNPVVPTPQDYFQTWMGVRYNAYGAWSAARNAWVKANFNCFSDQILPGLGTDYEYVGADGYVTSPPLP
jgi:hypothetical protein